MILEVYAVRDNPQPLVAAPAARDWMSEFPGRHAYRCLPLTIANTYGWQVLLPVDVVAEWNGGMGQEDITVACEHPLQAVSNFQRGVLTFDIGYVFRTPPGYHLLVSGPANVFRDGVAPMTAIIESDWLPYTFTANYQFTRPGKAVWKAGEPYAQVCLVSATLQEQVQPVIRHIGANPELEKQHQLWRDKRSDFLGRLAAGDEHAITAAWQKDYFRGRYADGSMAPAAHTSKQRMKIPIDERVA